MNQGPAPHRRTMAIVPAGAAAAPRTLMAGGGQYHLPADGPAQARYEPPAGGAERDEPRVGRQPPSCAERRGVRVPPICVRNPSSGSRVWRSVARI